MAVESPVRSWSNELHNAFLKKSKTFRTLYTSTKIIPLDYSGREERALKESMLNFGMLPILSLVLYTALVVGILSKRYLGD